VQLPARDLSDRSLLALLELPGCRSATALPFLTNAPRTIGRETHQSSLRKLSSALVAQGDGRRFRQDLRDVTAMRRVPAFFRWLISVYSSMAALQKPPQESTRAQAERAALAAQMARWPAFAYTSWRLRQAHDMLEMRLYRTPLSFSARPGSYEYVSARASACPSQPSPFSFAFLRTLTCIGRFPSKPRAAGRIDIAEGAQFFR
jgi:hypothetical protein